VRSVGLISILLFFCALRVPAQVTVTDPYLRISANDDDPLFTTYAASMERSRFFADKAYFMDYFSSGRPITYTSQYAGDVAAVWKVDNIVVSTIAEFYRRPVVVASFPDIAVLAYEPFRGLNVQEVFLVYSSGAAVVQYHVVNAGTIDYHVSLYPLLHLPEDSLDVIRFDTAAHGLVVSHTEPLERLHSNLYANRGYPVRFRDLLATSAVPASYGAYRACSVQDFYFAIKRMSKVHANVTELNKADHGAAQLVALQQDFHLRPGESTTIRFVRGVQDAQRPESELVADVKKAMQADVQSCVDANVSLFKPIPRITFKTADEKLVYLGAFNLVRQCMLPPSGQTKRNYYVFSRNPQWGWGHGHQVMHESLSMIPYAYLDPQSAEESQRVYMDQQYDDGLIAYRHGPRGPQVYPHQGEPTTSAPFFSWTNWEIYRVGHNREFLADAYRSGAKFIRWMETARDKNRDGMFEWGPYGIIENVRDGWNVVFQLFSEGEDEGRDISNQLDVLDLTLEVANEMHYLGRMAKELGDTAAVREWGDKFRKVAGLVNRYMWDPADRFYYNISMTDHSFSFEGASLKRKELIGFLPLWARVATPEHARDLVKELQNPASFWRTYGIPTLAANDPHFTPFVDGCCRWDGPVWLLWDYMVMDGLTNYGYTKAARQVGEKMLAAVTTQLKKNHRYWESYSPDYPVLECPQNYIWDSIMAKVLIDMYSGEKRDVPRSR
jgi:hypothetical protein